MANLTCQVEETLKQRVEAVRVGYERVVPRVGQAAGYSTSEIVREALSRGLTSMEAEIEAAADLAAGGRVS